jgi:hypothetical protein
MSIAMHLEFLRRKEVWYMSGRKESKRDIGFLHNILRSDFCTWIYWKLPFGEVINIQWDRSLEPNDQWRPWLETNAGYQGWGWDWRMSHSLSNNIEIKFSNKAMASMFLLGVVIHE